MTPEQKLRSKELMVRLAEKVQQSTGKNQNLTKLKQELFLARKNYAKRGEDRLSPIIEVVHKTPLWQVSIIEEDGTEKILGYQ